MAGNEKNQTGNTESGFNYQEQVHSDQFIALQGQISQCLTERRELVDSRNLFIKLTIASWAITLFVIFIYPGIAERKLEKHDQRQQAFRAAAKAELNRPRDCTPVQIPIDNSALQSASDYAEHLKQKLNPAPQRRTADTTAAMTKPPLPTNTEKTDPIPAAVEQTIKQTIYEWSIAWELQNTQRYLSYYAKGFTPEGGMTLYKWRNIRKDRIEKPTAIRIRLDDLNVIRFEKNKVTVEFIQHYMTSNYQDVTHKRLVLIKEDNQWKILRESVLG